MKRTLRVKSQSVETSGITKDYKEAIQSDFVIFFSHSCFSTHFVAALPRTRSRMASRVIALPASENAAKECFPSGQEMKAAVPALRSLKTSTVYWPLG